MTDPIAIDELPTTPAATTEDLLPVMRDGGALVITVDQLRQLISDSLMSLIDGKLPLTGGTLTGSLTQHCSARACCCRQRAAAIGPAAR
ncbi:hypothetical protein V6L77_00535 [Pannonibacter sp. Pt2-lr]